LLVAGALIAAQALFIPAKAQVAQVLMSNAWEQQLSTGDPARPWPWADFTPAAKLRFGVQHRSVLALTDAAGESLAFGPTLMAASVEPGQRGVAVFAAHRDTHFSFLGKLKPGDPVTVDMPDGSRTFRVTRSEVVRWDQSGIETHDGGVPRIALVTCWPLDAKVRGPMRLVVWAELAPEPTTRDEPSVSTSSRASASVSRQREHPPA
jgi:sortase A